MNVAMQFVWQLPLLILAVSGLFLVLMEAFATGPSRTFLRGLTVACCAMTAVAALILFRQLGGREPELLMGDMLVADRLSMFIILLIAGITAAVALQSGEYLREHQFESGEFYCLLILSATGMAVLAMANDLVTIFLGIETMSLGAYVLIASRRRSERSAEGAMKYFLMGAFATGILLYGIALIYGEIGSTGLRSILTHRDAAANAPLFIAGIFLLIVAFGFKVALVPFHMWTPDAYEGAPTPVTAFMAAAVKTGAIIAIVRVFPLALGGDVLPYGSAGWASIFAILAALSMTVGNIAALRQENVKRMLAYSSIAHAGTMVVGVVAMGVADAGPARAALLYYLLAYSVTTVGAFAIIVLVGVRGRERLLVSDWTGLASQRPGLALAMTLCLLSLGGIPPLAGFFGKFYVFRAAMAAPNNQLLWLVIVGVLNAAISIFYYLRLVGAMYFREAPVGDPEHPVLRSPAAMFVAVVSAVLIVEMGLMPGTWLGWLP